MILGAMNQARTLVNRIKVKTALNLLIPKSNYSEKDERFLRFIDFDANYLSQIPWVFTPLKPAIYEIRDFILSTNQMIGLPWWAVLIISSFISRLIIFPLIFVQMKKISRIGPVWPILSHIKQSWKQSDLPLTRKMKLAWTIYRRLAHQQKFKLKTVFVYNMAYYPILISMIFSLRSLLSNPQVAQSGFLYLSNLSEIDPYYILPTLTIAAYYWNFQRFITPENKHTLISRIRTVCQVFLIIWFPFLCCWPSGIVIYMFTNAIISIVQSNILKTYWFQSKLNPKITHYNHMLATVEYDKGTSQSIIQAIKTGQESLKEKAISEQVILLQTQKMVKNLNKQLQSQSIEETQQILSIIDQKVQEIEENKIEVKEQQKQKPVPVQKIKQAPKNIKKKINRKRNSKQK